MFTFSIYFFIFLTDLLYIDIKHDEHVYSFMEVLRKVGYKTEFHQITGPESDAYGCLEIEFPSIGNVRESILAQIAILESILEKAGNPSGSPLVSLFKAY